MSEPSDASADDEVERCGYPTQTGDPCRNPAGGDGFCHLDSHGAEDVDTVDDGRGAPEGNDHAAGNSGGGAPEGNTNALRTGLWTTISRVIEDFDDEETEAFEFYCRYYAQERGLQDPVKVKRIAMAEVMADRLEADLGRSLTKTVYSESGQRMEVLKESTVQAHQSYLRELRLNRDYAGLSVKRDPDSASGGHENIDLLTGEE
jgi:ribosomal protein L19